MTVPDTKIVVRDARRPGWFWIENELYRGGWAAEIGPYGVTVLGAIALHANNETQQAWPSYGTLVTLTKVGRTKVIAVVRELEAWGIIQVEPRFDSRGQSSNLYTLLDKSVWQKEVTLKVGKDKATGKEKWVTKRVKSFSAEADHEEVATGIECAEDIDDNGLPGEPPGVHEADGGSTCGEPGVVHHGNGGSAQGEHEQHSVDEKQETETNEQHSAGAAGGVATIPFSLSSWTDVLEKRSLQPEEEHELQRQLALHLLQHIAPDFSMPEVYLKKLSRDQLRRIGAVLMLMYGKSVNLETLSNPAGFLRSKAECPDEAISGIDRLLMLWLLLVERVKSGAKEQGKDSGLEAWVSENGLKEQLLEALDSCGLKQAWAWE